MHFQGKRLSAIVKLYRLCYSKYFDTNEKANRHSCPSIFFCWYKNGTSTLNRCINIQHYEDGRPTSVSIMTICLKQVLCPILITNRWSICQSLWTIAQDQSSHHCKIIHAERGHSHTSVVWYAVFYWLKMKKTNKSTITHNVDIAELTEANLQTCRQPQQ